MFKWKEEYNTGIEEIDNQHKKLFNIGNNVYDLLKNDFCIDKYDKIISIINELKEYTIFHFKEEEEFLLKIKYKKFLSHKVEHNEFKKQLELIDFNKIDDGQDEYIEGLLNIIYDWISEHILIKDIQYTKEYFKLNKGE